MPAPMPASGGGTATLLFAVVLSIGHLLAWAGGVDVPDATRRSRIVRCADLVSAGLRGRRLLIRVGWLASTVAVWAPTTFSHGQIGRGCANPPVRDEQRVNGSACGNQETKT